MLTELGLGGEDYLQAQHRQAATVGSINAFSSMRGAVGDEQDISGNFVISSKALLKSAGEQSQLMRATLETARIDETGRIRELIAQQRARRAQAITGNGHGLAMAAASAGMSPLANLNHQLSGMNGIKSLRELDDSLQDEHGLQKFASSLEEIHRE